MTQEKTATRMPAIGDIFAGDYEILEFAGAGGYAHVFRAHARHLDSEVAVKVLDPTLSGSALDAFLQRFYREALLTSALAHPNTVTPIDYGRTPEGTAYIAMEFLNGESIADMLDRGKIFSIKEVTQIVIDVLESLDEAHAHGIVHADIKSSNIFIQKGNPNARVLDFGVAALIDDEQNAAQVFGTPHYIAPEAAVGNPIGPESDIYSLGITAYEMLFGKFPFDGDSPRDILKAHVVSKMPPLGEEIEHTPIGEFISLATSKSPDIRPSAYECIQILQDGQPQERPRLAAAITPNPAISQITGRLPTTGRLPSLKLRSIPDDAPRDVYDSSAAMHSDVTARLYTAVARGLDGHASVVVLRGPGGVGKERIIRRVLASDSLHLEEEQVFYMLAEDCLRSNGRYDTTVLLQQLPRRFSGFEMLIKPAEELAKELHANPHDPLLQGKFADLIIAMAQKRPFVWVLTSLQRVDSSVTQLLSILLDRLQEIPAPLSIILSLSDTEPVASKMTSYFLRNTQARVWPNCEELTITRLSRRDMFELADNLEPMAENVANILVDMANGNPGRLTWLLREARERKILRVERGQLVRRLRADFSILEQDLSRRAELRDQILPVLEEENALEWTVGLALVGPHFSERIAVDLLTQITSINIPPTDALAAIVDRNILERYETSPNEIAYTFHHHGAVEALISALPKESQQHLLMKVAVVLERDDQNPQSIGRAAELYARLEDHRVAAQCADAAATLAARQGNVEQAAKYYNMALSEIQLADTRFGPDFLTHVEIGVARSKLREGALGTAEQLLQTAMGRAIEAALDPIELETHLLLAQIAVARSDVPAIGSRAKRMMQLAKESDNPKQMIRALLLVGEFSQYTGRRKEGAKFFIQAEKLATEHDLLRLRARARMGIGRLLGEEQKWDRAEQLMQEAINYFRSIERVDLLIECLVDLGNVRLQAGKAGDSLFRDAERLSEEYGYGRVFADILSGQAQSLVQIGELNAATILFLRAVERYRLLGSRRGEANTLLWLAKTSLRRRQIEAARTYIVEALDAHRAAHDTSGYIESLVLGSEIALARHTPEQSHEWATEAIGRLDGKARPSELLCRALIAQSKAATQLGMSEQANSAIAQAHAIAQENQFQDLLERIERTAVPR